MIEIIRQDISTMSISEIVTDRLPLLGGSGRRKDPYSGVSNDLAVLWVSLPVCAQGIQEVGCVSVKGDIPMEVRELLNVPPAENPENEEVQESQELDISIYTAGDEKERMGWVVAQLGFLEAIFEVCTRKGPGGVKRVISGGVVTQDGEREFNVMPDSLEWKAYNAILELAKNTPRNGRPTGCFNCTLRRIGPDNLRRYHRNLE